MERPRFDAQREREFVTRGWWRDDTLPRWLGRHARERPDSQAVAFSGGALTWKALQERVLRAAQGLKARGVETGVHYAPAVHGHAAWGNLPLMHGSLPVAEMWASQELSLPMHPYLEDDQIAFVVDRLRSLLADS